MKTATKPLPDEMLLEDVVTSPRALKALTEKGFKKVGDIRSVQDVSGMKGVTPGALAQLAEAGVRKERGEIRDDEIEEGEHNVVLRSRHLSYVVRIVGGDVLPPIHQGARPRVIDPVAVYFKQGAAVLTRELWLVKKHHRDLKAVAAEMAKPAAEAPWRRDAIAYLRSLGAHVRGDFTILE